MNTKQNSMVMWAVFIVLIVIMVGVAVSKYTALSDELRIAKARNLAAGLSAATAVNYTQKKFDPTKGIAITNCKDVTHITGSPTQHRISDKAVQSEIITHCTLTGPGIAGVQFSEIGIK